jgi:hypothetical protein
MKVGHHEKQRFRRDVLRRYRRGESEEKILKALAKRGLNDTNAQAIFEEVVRGQITRVRLRYWKKIFIGVLLIAGSIALGLNLWWLGENVTSRTIRCAVVLILLIGVGAWFLLEGLIGLLNSDPRSDHYE